MTHRTGRFPLIAVVEREPFVSVYQSIALSLNRLHLGIHRPVKVFHAEKAIR